MLYRKGVDWAINKDEITTLVTKKTPIIEIAGKYGVSVSRMYQVLRELGISSPLRYKNSKFKTQKKRWLSKILYNKKLSTSERMDLLENLELPDFCPVLGLRLSYEFNTGYSDCSPSLDQIIPGAGYYPENVEVMSLRANRIKCDATLEEVEKLYLHMKKRML